MLSSSKRRELYTGSADAHVRNAPRGARCLLSKIKIISRFALSADEGVRAPSTMSLPNPETELLPRELKRAEPYPISKRGKGA